jgi:hypothetical protein
MIYRVRKQLVEEGFEAVLSRKQRATLGRSGLRGRERNAVMLMFRESFLLRLPKQFMSSAITISRLRPSKSGLTKGTLRR